MNQVSVEMHSKAFWATNVHTKDMSKIRTGGWTRNLTQASISVICNVRTAYSLRLKYFIPPDRCIVHVPLYWTLAYLRDMCISNRKILLHTLWPNVCGQEFGEQVFPKLLPQCWNVSVCFCITIFLHWKPMPTCSSITTVTVLPGSVAQFPFLIWEDHTNIPKSSQSKRLPQLINAFLKILSLPEHSLLCISSCPYDPNLRCK